MIKRIIPSSKEELPAVGLGTWKTFDVRDSNAKQDLETVLYKLHAAGGRLIDSSPMYGLSEQVIGDITSHMKIKDDFFYATKVWTSGLQEGIQQMDVSMQKMQRKTMDLIQIHNLVDWKTHLATLRRWKETGKVRYIGITHYTDTSHEELEKIIRLEKIDFVQFNYSIVSRHAEKRLLDAAKDSGVATLINRPLGEGNLFKKVTGKSLPAWAAEIEIDSWSVYFLKYILSHSAVTCVIPATGNPTHADDNIRAGIGKLPNATERKKMAEYIDSL